MDSRQVSGPGARRGLGWFAAGCVAAGLAVALGAFAAHGLRNHVEPALLATFETGARYHMYHALALLAVGWLAARGAGRLADAAGISFVVGIVLFAGSLYAMALTGHRALGAITPLGGLAFLLGWACLAAAALRFPTRPN